MTETNVYVAIENSFIEMERVLREQIKTLIDNDNYELVSIFSNSLNLTISTKEILLDKLIEHKCLKNEEVINIFNNFKT